MDSTSPVNQQSSTELQVLVFGPQARMVGTDRLTLKELRLPTAANELLSRIGNRYPELAASLSVSRLAVNQEFVDTTALINTGDEVALIGLISGG